MSKVVSSFPTLPSYVTMFSLMSLFVEKSGALFSVFTVTDCEDQHYDKEIAKEMLQSTHRLPLHPGKVGPRVLLTGVFVLFKGKWMGCLLNAGTHSSRCYAQIAKTPLISTLFTHQETFPTPVQNWCHPLWTNSKAFDRADGRTSSGLT